MNPGIFFKKNSVRGKQENLLKEFGAVLVKGFLLGQLQVLTLVLLMKFCFAFVALALWVCALAKNPKKRALPSNDVSFMASGEACEGDATKSLFQGDANVKVNAYKCFESPYQRTGEDKSWVAKSISFQYLQVDFSGIQDGAFFVGGNTTKSGFGGFTDPFVVEFGNWFPQQTSLLIKEVRHIGYSYLQNTLVAVGTSAVGGAEIVTSHGGTTATYSDTFLSFSVMANATGSVFSVRGNGVVFGTAALMWVAVGEGKNTIAYSRDGSVWYGLDHQIFSVEGRSVAYSPELELFVATGAGTAHYVAYSKDGIDWKGAPTAFTLLGGGGGSQIAYGVVKGTPCFVVVGTGGSNTIIFSNDGMNWLGAGNNFLTKEGNAVAFAPLGSYFVAGGAETNGTNKGVVVYSTNGMNWTDPGLPRFKTRVVAIGSVSPNLQGTIADGASNTGSFVVVPYATQLLTSPTTISESMIVQGALNLTSSASLKIKGSCNVGGRLIMQQGALISVGSRLNLNPLNASLLLVLGALPFKKRLSNQTVVVQVASYANYSGSFASVQVEYPPANCYIASDPTTDYLPTACTVSITFSPDPVCSDGTTTPVSVGGLSGGAIAGIVVGCVVGGLLIGLSVLLIWKYKRTAYMKAVKGQLQQQQMEDVTRASVQLSVK